MKQQFFRLMSMWLWAAWLLACGVSAPPTSVSPQDDTPIASPVATVAVDGGAPTRMPEPPAPTPAATAVVQPVAPAPGAGNKPAQDIFASLNDTQKACLREAWGDQVYNEITSFMRAPNADEQAAIQSCHIMPPNPGGAGPGAGAGGHQASRDQTFVTYSADGVVWSTGVLLAESASVPEIIYTSKGEYWAYWVDFSESTSPNAEQIGVAFSTDGKNWQKRGFATFAGGEGMTPVDPDAFELDDGRLRMYFYDIADRTSHKFYSAVSSDGINFTVEPGIRFEADQIYDPNVVRLPDGRYRMYINHTDIWSATSSDGLVFVKDDGERVSKGAVPGALVLPDGQVRLYVCQQGISLYTSSDGLVFDAVAQGIIQAPGIVCDPSVAATPDGFIMVYKFAEMANLPAPPATSP